MVLICISLMISDIEHSFMYLLAICMSFGKGLFRSSAYLFLLFLCLPGETDPQNISKTNFQELMCYAFFWDFYGFRFYFKSLIYFWVYFCMWYKIMIQIHSFAHSSLVFPTLFIKETVFCTLYILVSFAVGWLTIYSWVCFWALCSLPLICVSVSVSVPLCLNSITLYQNLKSGSMISPVLFFFLKTALAT